MTPIQSRTKLKEIANLILWLCLLSSLVSCSAIIQSADVLAPKETPRVQVLIPEEARPALLAYYKFEGNFLDSSGMGQGLTARNGAHTVRVNEVNQALEVNGLGDWAFIENLKGLNGNQASVSLWARTQNPVRSLFEAPFQGTLFSAFNGNLVIDATSNNQGHDRIRYYLQGDTSLEVGQPLEDGILENQKWHHIVINYTSNSTVQVSSYQIFWDGNLLYEGYSNGVNSLVPNKAAKLGFLLGAAGYDGRSAEVFFHGQIDEVSVFQRPLSATEVQKIHDLQSPLMNPSEP